MLDAKTYEQFAAECRRLAKTMSAKDAETLLAMAEAWESRRQEAERVEKQKNGKDGNGKDR
jgi:hypothetical protein